MSTITTINATDLITNSRSTINTNFSNLNTDKIETSYIDTDTTLAANSDSKIATQKAVKTYIDSSGGVNASETARGIVEEATDAEVQAGTATGATGAKLVVTPAKLLTNNGVITMVADENITAGAPVGISNYVTGLKVARALRYEPTATISFSAQADNQKPSTICPIGGDKFVFLNYALSGDTLYATVGSVTPGTKTLTLGTSLAVTADIFDGPTNYSICKLNTDKFIVFYREDASTTIIKYRVGTVSGTTITFGTAATFATGATSVEVIDCDQIGTDKGIMFYGASTVTDSRLIAFTTSGTVATAGTPLAIGTTIDNNISGARVKKIATDKFILATTAQRVQVGTLSGTTITLGAETAIPGTATNGYINIVSPADNTAVFSIKDGSNAGELSACTVSGTTPTFGSVVTMAQYDHPIYAESSTSILVGSYQSNGWMKKYTLSGTTLTLSGTVTYYLLDSEVNNILGLDNGYFIAFVVGNTTFKYNIQGMSNNFFGIAQSTVSKGASVNVKYKGIDSNQSGLTPGGQYLIDSSGLTLATHRGTLNTVNDKYLLALSATQILL